MRKDLTITKKDILSAPILIIDDEIVNTEVLSGFLEFKGFTNYTAENYPERGIELYRENDYAIVLLDINMPILNGFEVMQKFAEIDKPQAPPVLILTALNDKETCNKSFEFGANDFLTKPFNFEETKHRIINLIEMHLLRSRLENKNRMLEDIVAERTRALKESQTQIIQHLGMAAEYKDMETAAHTVRVGWYSRIIGERWGMDAEALELLFLTAPMHDIGKIGIPDNVLLKPDKFEPEEWEIMKSHTTIGEKILQGNSNPLVETAKTIALTHHEKWDGTGYPSGLSGNDIPIEGRIVMIADVFDALTITRPYKKAWTTDEAVAHIVEGSGSSFDPDLVVIFQEALADLLEIKERYKD